MTKTDKIIICYPRNYKRIHTLFTSANQQTDIKIFGEFLQNQTETWSSFQGLNLIWDKSWGMHQVSGGPHKERRTSVCVSVADRDGE